MTTLTDTPPGLTPTKPYLIRAIYQWCADQGFTPYLAVFVDQRVRVPMEFVQDQQIVLNVCMDAVQNLDLGNDFVTFSARFRGVARHIVVPVSNVTAIYARENGHGMAFEMADDVLADATSEGVEADVAPEVDAAPAVHGVQRPGDQTSPEPPGTGGKGKPRFTVVK